MNRLRGLLESEAMGERWRAGALCTECADSPGQGCPSCWPLDGRESSAHLPESPLPGIILPASLWAPPPGLQSGAWQSTVGTGWQVSSFYELALALTCSIRHSGATDSEALDFNVSMLAREIERVLILCPDPRRLEPLLVLMSAVRRAEVESGACAGELSVLDPPVSRHSSKDDRSVFSAELARIFQTLALHPDAERTSRWRNRCSNMLSALPIPGSGAIGTMSAMADGAVLKSLDETLKVVAQVAVTHVAQVTVAPARAGASRKACALLVQAYHGRQRTWLWSRVVGRVAVWRGVDAPTAEAVLRCLLSTDGKGSEALGHKASTLEAIMELYRASQLPRRAVSVLGSEAVARGARLLHVLVESARVSSLAKGSKESDSLKNLPSAGLQGGSSAEECGEIGGSAGLVECARMALSSGARDRQSFGVRDREWLGARDQERLGARDQRETALRDATCDGGGVGGGKVEAIETERAVGLRLATLVARCRLVHTPQLLVACAAFALQGLRPCEAVGEVLATDGPAVAQDPKESVVWEGVAYLCRVCSFLLAGCAHPAAKDGDLKQGSCGGEAQDGVDIGANSSGVVFATRGEEITSLAVLVLIDALLPSLALAISSRACLKGASAEEAAAHEQGKARVRGELEALLREAEAVSFATRPDGSRFAAHLQVGAIVRAHVLLVLRSLDPT